MKNPWFEHKRRFYKPVSIYGWLVSAAAAGYIVFSVIRITEKMLKLNQTLMEITLQVILTAVVYVLIAYFTQKR